jgi:NADH-quinone oxidoreductase subunit E
MCTGRVDPSFVITAFKEMADGIIIVGCLPGECHYTTDGNIHAYSMTLILKKILKFIGIEPERLRMEFLSSAEGVKFAEVMQDFINEMRKLGPIGKKEGLQEEMIVERLSVVLSLIPYLKLVERERLGFSGKDVKKMQEYFESTDVNRMIEELIFEKITMGLILKAKRKGLHGYGELAKRTSQDEKQVFRMVSELEAQGFLRPGI